MAENQEIVKQEPKKSIEVYAEDNGSFSSYLDTAKFMQIQRVAAMFASSDMVPVHYRGKVANCALAIHMATRLEMDPMMFMQNSYVISGKPGLQAVVAIALVNSRGPFTGPIQWKFAGTIKDKTRQCTAYAKHKVTGEICETTVTWAMVEAEGWNKKAGSKWLTLPDLMFQYRSGSFLARLYCPEVILGLPTAEELEDIDAGTEYKPTEKVSDLNEKLNRKKVASVQQEPTAEETAKQLSEAEAHVEDILPDIEHPKPTTKPEPTDAEIQAELEKAALDDAEIAEFAQKPVQKAKQAAPDASESKISTEQRYECQTCGMYFEKPAGLNKNLCPKLHVGIVDRWNPKQ